MERAGAAVAELVLRQFPGSVTVVCGKGNNGGDGKVCARVLHEAGREVRVVDGVGDLGEPDVIVDALLGIGLRDAPREDAARMIELINADGRPVVAVDVPSGVNASTGEVPGVAVRATATVTFGAAKVGLAISPGRFHAGSVHIAPIGLRPREHEHALVPASALLEVPRKHRGSTKYTAGSVLVVGGSRGLTGAPMLTARAAFRADAGYVAVAAPGVDAAGARDLAARGREAPVAGGLRRPAAAAVRRRGPRGRRESERRRDRARARPQRRHGRARPHPARAARRCRSCSTPMRSGSSSRSRAQAPTVLTPHSGELARLLGTESREIDAHRLDSVRRAASLFGAVVLLKGADTIVAAPREGVLVATYGTPSLATAGSGDVLTGIVAAFLAKGMDPRLAAGTAAVAHGVAAELVEEQPGLIASDLLPALQRALAGHGLQRAPLA